MASSANSSLEARTLRISRFRHLPLVAVFAIGVAILWLGVAAGVLYAAADPSPLTGHLDA